MFCNECGSPLSEDAMFCPECGAEVTSENAASKTGKIIQENILKKIGKLPVIIGAAILVVAIIALNWNGKVDYVDTVAKHTPFAKTEGLPYTYEEVLNRYLVSTEWKVREEGDIHYVDISGMANGAEGRIDIAIKVTPNPDDPNAAAIHLESVTFDDTYQLFEGEAAGFLYSLFSLYDEGYEDLSALMGVEDETGIVPQGGTSQTETFTDENTGISFQYPAEWVVSYPTDGSGIAVIFDPESTDERAATLSVGVYSPSDPATFGVFSEEEETVIENLNSYTTLLAYEDTMLGDIPAKIIKVMAEGYVSDYVLYRIGEDIYRVSYFYTEAYADFYEPLFDAVMDSYTVSTAISMDSGISGDISEPDIRFNDIPVTELLKFNTSEVIGMFGDIYYTGADGSMEYDEIEFYLMDDDTVGGIKSFYPENFSINGHLFEDVSGEGVFYSDEIVDLLGTDYEEENSDWYYMVYHYPAYAVAVGVNKFNEIVNIEIYSSLYEQNGLSDDTLLEMQEPIEYYQRLGGTYSADAGQATLSVGIYSSQEEGETAIGNAVIYTEDGQYFAGSLIPIDTGTYQVTTATGEEVLLKEASFSDEVLLELYVDGQYIEQYYMTEHYVP